MRKCRVAFKFCGCCNPYVDLSRIARYLHTIAESCNDFEIVPLASGDAGVVVILCGCSRACADRAENRIGKLATVVVAGESVDGEMVPEPELPLAVGRKLVSVLCQLKGRCNPCS